MEIIGAFDKNLKELEKFTGSEIYCRGNSITIRGDKSSNDDYTNSATTTIFRQFIQKIDKD